MRGVATAIVLAAIVSTLSADSEKAKTSVLGRAPSFTLNDQDDKPLEILFPRDRIVVFGFADREGGDDVDTWIPLIRDKYGDRIDVYGVAVLAGIPSMMHAGVRLMVKQRARWRVMLDWEGDASKAFGCVKGVSNVVVVAANGDILCRVRRAATKERLENVFELLDAALEDEPTGAP